MAKKVDMDGWDTRNSFLVKSDNGELYKQFIHLPGMSRELIVHK